MNRLTTALVTIAVGLGACTGGDETPESGAEMAAVALGPADGHDLPGVDLERVQVGRPAPDFTLTSLAGPPLRLSSFRGAKNVVLVFYRGHW